PTGLAPFMPNQLAITALSVYGATPGSTTSTSLQVDDGFAVQDEVVLRRYENTGGAIAWEKNPAVGVLRQPTWTWIGSNSGATFLAYVDPPMVIGLPQITPTPVTLQETVRRLLIRCNMIEGTHFDVSALASI